MNRFIKCEHFKLEDLRMVIQLIFPQYFLGSIDLEDAYYLVSIHPSSRKYLRFFFNGKLYEFTCLPSGLCTAPFIFTKIMRVVMSYLRVRGLTSIIYLDDILCIEKSKEKCYWNIQTTTELLEWLGFLISYKKSCLEPSTKCKFLGLMLDTKRYLVELPDEKRINILTIVKKSIGMNSCSIRDFATLIGKLIACCPAVEYGWLYT